MSPRRFIRRPVFTVLQVKWCPRNLKKLRSRVERWFVVGAIGDKISADLGIETVYGTEVTEATEVEGAASGIAVTPTENTDSVDEAL